MIFIHRRVLGSLLLSLASVLGVLYYFVLFSRSRGNDTVEGFFEFSSSVANEDDKGVKGRTSRGNLDRILSKEALKRIVGETVSDAARFYVKWKSDTKLNYVLPYTLHFGFLARLGSPPGGDARSWQKAVLMVFEAAEEDSEVLLTYDYDPRLATTVYYSAVASRLELGIPLADIKLAFSWYDWTDMSVLNDFIELPSEQKPDSAWVSGVYFPVDELLMYERMFGHKLFEVDRARALAEESYDNSNENEGEVQKVDHRSGSYCNTSESLYMPGFVCSSILDSARPEVYRIQARSRLHSHGPIPLSITFLRKEGKSIQVAVSNKQALDNKGRPYNLLYNGLLKKYIKSALPRKGRLSTADVNFDNVETFRHLERKVVGDKAQRENSTLPFLLHVSPEEFEFDPHKKIEELLADFDNLSQHQLNYLRSLQYSFQTHYVDVEKFFHEAEKVTGYTHRGHHFDSRFFNGAVEETDLCASLDAIVRAWLSFTTQNNLTSWISHGTLYSWMYNGQAFPWDGDHDMQMPIAQLNKLAENFNQSVIVEDPTVGNGRYFLDVSHSLTSRIHGNGRNNIDARFIDVNIGVYIDITGISVSSDGVEGRLDWLFEKFLVENSTAEMQEDLTMIKNVTDLLPTEIIKKERDEGRLTKERHTYLQELGASEYNGRGTFKNMTRDELYSINKYIQAYNCRNHHFYTLWELAPLRLTYFHGMAAYMPNLYVRILRAEYGVPQDYGYASFDGKEFLPDLRMWMLESEVSKIANEDGTSDLPHVIEKERIKSPTRLDLWRFLENYAKSLVHEEQFFLLARSADTGLFRLKELALRYDTTMSSEQNDALSEEFVKNRSFDGIYKDNFQQRLERMVWDSYIHHYSSNIPEVLREVDNIKQKQLIKKILTDAISYIDREVKWEKLGNQAPASDINFNHFGQPVHLLGERIKNSLFANDPVYARQDLAEIYHTKDEEKYKPGVEEAKQRIKKEEGQRRAKEGKGEWIDNLGRF